MKTPWSSKITPKRAREITITKRYFTYCLCLPINIQIVLNNHTTSFNLPFVSVLVLEYQNIIINQTIYRRSLFHFSSCVIDMQAFPYDEQNCSLRFGNIIESEVMVNITTSQTEADMKYFIPSSEFHVKRAGIGRESTEVSAEVMFLFNTAKIIRNAINSHSARGSGVFCKFSVWSQQAHNNNVIIRSKRPCDVVLT